MAPKTIVSWVARIGIAGMFIMAAVPKLTAQAEAQQTFAELGGSAMMVITGVMELVAAVLLLVPRTRVVGAVLALGVMGGAIVSHLAVLGLGGMFPLAVVLFLLAGVLVLLHREKLPVIGGAVASAQAPTEPNQAPA